ncbi:MAG: carboxypeptidase regulatory-like domain-containing protein, partial [Chloroflexi bacterium]|nr:carboxypeptidase regulatory-like domain-containing protein [Chloroflexota bacterium]
MHLRDFPRPPSDNGRGIHWSAGVYHPVGQDLSAWIRRLEEMQVKWVKVLDDGGGSSTELCELLLEQGMMPIVRLYRREPNPGHIGGREEDALRSLVGRGVRYFETNNEPDLPVEWKGGHMPRNWLDVVTDHFIIDADKVLGLGGLPAVPAMGVGSRANLVAKVVERGRSDLFQHGAWLAIHNYTLKHPLDYPYDAVNQEGTPLSQEEYDRLGSWAWDGHPRSTVNQWRADDKNPGDTLQDDAACWLAFQLANQQAVEALGYSIPILSTEGGAIIGTRDDRRYPRVTPALHRDWTVAMNDYLQREAPEYYFTMCHWLIANYGMGHFAPGWESQSWFTNWWISTFDLRDEIPTVQAVREMPSLTRGEPLGEGALHGQVRGPDGAPLSGLVVTLLREQEDGELLSQGTTLTDAEGRFRWAELAPGSYALAIEAWGVVRRGLRLDDLQSVEVSIELHEGRRSRLTGTVQDEAGAPAESFPVTLSRGAETWQTHTDTQGQFRFEGLGPGVYTLTSGSVSRGLLWLNGWDAREQPLSVPGAGFQYAVAQKRLLPPEEGLGKHLFFGVITDAEGQELRGIAVEMRWSGAAPGTRFPQTRSGADLTKSPGYYQFLNTPGDFSLRVVQADWPSQTADGLRTADIAGYGAGSASYQVDFRLGPWAQPLPHSVVRGTLVGAPLGTRLVLSMGAERWQALPDEDGRFEIAGLPAGTATLEATAIGVLARGILLDGRNLYEVEYPLGSRVEGSLVGAEPGQVVVLQSLTWGWARETRTDPYGSYTFAHAPAGEYRVVVGPVESDLLRLDGQAAVELPPLDVSALSRSAVEGTLQDRAGRPQPWVKVLLRAEGGDQQEGWTDAQGRFRFDNLAPGNYHLLTDRLGSLREEVALKAREHKRLVLTAPAPRPLGCYLLLGKPSAPGAWVHLLLAFPALRRLGAVAGFRLPEAAQARQVLILAGPGGVSPEEEQVLAQGGCTVERLGGDAYEVACALRGRLELQVWEPLGPPASGPQNDAAGYGVRVEPCAVPPGHPFWKVESVHHLTPAENRGCHHLFVDCLDEADERVSGSQVRVSWHPWHELLLLGQKAPPSGVNFPLWKEIEYSVAMEGLPSEQVVGLHTGHPDEPTPAEPLGNTLYHHSFAIRFRRAAA